MPEKLVSVRKLSILLLLQAPDNHGREAQPLVGITRLQKLLFLLSQELQGISPDRLLRFDMKFEPNRFGPADMKLYQDLDFLAALGHIQRQAVQSSTPDMPPSYADASETSLTFEYLMADEELVGDYAALEQGPSETFAIAPRGVKLLASIEGNLNERDKRVFASVYAAARRVRERYGGWPLEKLLRHVYSENPAMITASEIRNRVLGPRAGA